MEAADQAAVSGKRKAASQRARVGQLRPALGRGAAARPARLKARPERDRAEARRRARLPRA